MTLTSGRKRCGVAKVSDESISLSAMNQIRMPSGKSEGGAFNWCTETRLVVTGSDGSTLLVVVVVVVVVVVG